MSLFGEIGGVAYSGDMQPTSERSARKEDLKFKPAIGEYFASFGRTKIQFMIVSLHENVRMTAHRRTVVVMLKSMRWFRRRVRRRLIIFAVGR